jgi:hypothetical protein
VGYFAATIHEDADLAADLEADFGEFAGEFLVDHAIAREAASGQALKPSNLIRFKTAGATEDVDENLLLEQLTPSI